MRSLDNRKSEGSKSRAPNQKSSWKLIGSLEARKVQRGRLVSSQRLGGLSVLTGKSRRLGGGAGEGWGLQVGRNRKWGGLSECTGWKDNVQTRRKCPSRFIAGWAERQVSWGLARLR